MLLVFQAVLLVLRILILEISIAITDFIGIDRSISFSKKTREILFFFLFLTYYSVYIYFFEKNYNLIIKRENNKLYFQIN